MARAQRLAEQVKTMSARIKHLEAALAKAENGSLALAALGDGPDSRASSQDCEPTDVEYEGELDSVSKSLGSLAINSEGKAQYYGATVGAEVRSLSPVLSPSHKGHCSFCNVSCQKFVPSLCIARRILSTLSGRKLRQAPRAQSRIQSTWACPAKFSNWSTRFRSGFGIVLT
jgi:hypothetical protein